LPIFEDPGTIVVRVTGALTRTEIRDRRQASRADSSQNDDRALTGEKMDRADIS
jgi:hypothetical protein